MSSKIPCKDIGVRALGLLRKAGIFISFLGRNEKESYLCRPKFWLVMLAVVKIAGQQFKVQKGQELYVPHLEGNAGDKVEFADVLLVDNDGKLTAGSDVKVKIQAEIVRELKGDKVIAFKMKRRKGFRKKHGHRTQYTQIRINEIA
jgi:large subunit ribosomal protein L21